VSLLQLSLETQHHARCTHPHHPMGKVRHHSLSLYRTITPKRFAIPPEVSSLKWFFAPDSRGDDHRSWICVFVELCEGGGVGVRKSRHGMLGSLLLHTGAFAPTHHPHTRHTHIEKCDHPYISRPTLYPWQMFLLKTCAVNQQQ